MPITREVRTSNRLDSSNKHDLTVITAAERLFLWRHRMKSSSGRLLGRNGAAMNQAEAAAHLGINPGRYNNLENGLRTGLSAEEAERLAAPLNLDPVPGELCFIARRRSGLLLSTIERELGVSRPRFHELERAGAAMVLRHWATRGFLFPSEVYSLLLTE